MRIPGCPHEVEPVERFGELRSGQTVYTRCRFGKLHCVVLTRQCPEPRCDGGWKIISPVTWCRCRAGEIHRSTVRKGWVYRIVDPRAKRGDEDHRVAVGAANILAVVRPRARSL